MQLITPLIKLHTIQEDQGTYLNNLIIEHQGNNYHLHGSTGTTIYVYSESVCIYVLSTNRAFSTIGLYAFMVPEPDYINSITLHSPKEIREYLGNKWEALKPLTIVQKLITYLY